MVEEKYSKIPIGDISEGWEVIRLKDVSLGFVSGGTPSTKNPAYWDGDISWMTSAHINGRTVTQGVKCITEDGLKNSATNIVPKNNILITTRVGIGKVAVNLVDMTISQDLTGVVLDHKKVNVDFIYWLLSNHTSKLKSLAQGSTIKRLFRKEIENLKLPLPPLPEQHRIAEILTTADTAIRKVDDAVAKTERLKRGLMQELLTKGIGHEEFKDSEVGRIPRGWDVASIGDHTSLKSGIYFKFSEFSDKGIRCLKIDNVGFGEIVWNTITYLPEDYFNRYQDLVLKVGDIVIALNRPIINNKLKIGILKEADSPSILYQRVGKIVFKKISKIEKSYLFFLLKSESFKNQLSRYLIGTDQPYIRTPVFLKIKVPIPPTSEQRKISEILSTVDKKLELERKRKEKLERIKKGLMSELLTGKKRVKIVR